MSIKRVFLLLLLVAACCHQAGFCQDTPSLLSDESPGGARFGKQLRINRDALLKGSSERMRIDAATVMLFSNDNHARKILLAVLQQSNNTAARMAVCKALILTRTSQERLKKETDFIQPLLGILTNETGAVAKLAAEATLIFEYQQISRPLEKLTSDRSLPDAARLNAIEALKLQPDMEAIFALMELMDDEPENPVAKAAEKALQGLAIPIGKDAKTRRQIREELKRKGKNAFLRDWLIQKEDQMRELKAEKDMWQEQYLQALTQVYEGKQDDTVKAQFLAVRLGDAKAVVRLWALERAYQGRVGTQSKLAGELGLILVRLVSDEDRDVRLQTATLLSLMGELNSSEQLLEQLKVEQDEQVKTELFVALGEACRYAFSPNSSIELPAEVRLNTLDAAVEFLFDKDSKRAQNGAEVIRKLLEQDGYSSSEANKYLGALVQRYDETDGDSDPILRGGLLNTMAQLCAESSGCMERAAKLFESSFKIALGDESDLVREAGVDGLINIDQRKALGIFVEGGLINDSSAGVRKKVILLAGQVGGEGDMDWLAVKLDSEGESELAWQGMLRIFEYCQADVVDGWIRRFDSGAAGRELTEEQYIAILEIAERKADAEKKTDMVEDVTERLAELYDSTGQLDRAARYLGRVLESIDVNDVGEIDEIQGWCSHARFAHYGLAVCIY